MALTLCGLSISNYYNKVKLALLEKDVPFAEEAVATGRSDEAVLSASPLAKIPFVRLDDGGVLCESQPILDYIEERWPEPALLPSQAYARAKVRELIVFVDLHLELVARELYSQAFFGGKVSEANAERVRKALAKNIPAFRRLAKFAPFVGGERFTQADCAAWNSLPLVGTATKALFGEDLLLAGGVDWKGYVKAVGERPSAQRVAADRKAAFEQLAAARK